MQHGTPTCNGQCFNMIDFYRQILSLWSIWNTQHLLIYQLIVARLALH